MLFELLVLAGAQVELSWTTILRKRDAYRSAFSGFDPVAVASFTEKQMQSLEADRSLSLAGAKIRGVVENAQRILEVVEEHGSLDKYFWGFLNLKPMINSYRYPKQVPVKTSKSESISKDLVRRGFRFVGPTIIYSFMQAAGMTNDHLMQCFRHQECSKLPSLLAQEEAQSTQQKPCFMQHYDGSEIFSLAQDEAQQKQGQEQCFLQHYEDSEIFLLAQEEALQKQEQEQCFLQHYDVSEIFSLVQEEAQPKQEQEQWFLQQYDDSEIFSLAQEEVQQKQGQEQCFLQPYDDSQIFSLPPDMDLEVQAEQEQHSNDQESQEQQEEEEQQQLEYCTYRRGQENQLSSDDETV